MVVAYFTSAHFMDVMLETIQTIKHKVELHVFIEITNHSKHSTIVSVDHIDHLNFIETPENVLGEKQWAYFKPYFEGVKCVQFVVHTNKRSFSFQSLFTSFKFGRTLKKYHFDIFHFDNVSLRALGLYPFLVKKNLVISMHDPVSHVGEENWKDTLMDNLFFKHSKAFILYSAFSGKLFLENKKKYNAPSIHIQLQPYTFVHNFLTHQKELENAKHILFFGRLSYYKGIDILLEAIPIVLEKYPNQQFLIAGKSSSGYTIDEEIIKKYPDNIKLVNKFITTSELIHLIESSKLVVCPYREATQSGVLMTTFAAGKTVVANDVGSFGEYIADGINGMLSKPDAQSFALKIIEALDNDQYLQLEKNVSTQSSPEIIEKIGNIIVGAYQNALN
jgi:glycosyltransferase involved in cell wall biosynthesis